MRLSKQLLITVVLALFRTFVYSQANFLAYGNMRYADIESLTPRYKTHGLMGRKFRHRLVIPDFKYDTLELMLPQDTFYLTQDLGPDEKFRNILASKNSTIKVFNSHGKSFKIKKMKVTETLDHTIIFKARIKEKGQINRWVSLELNRSELAGIFVGNTFPDIPLIFVGTVTGAAMLLVIEALLDEEE